MRPYFVSFMDYLSGMPLLAFQPESPPCLMLLPVQPCYNTALVISHTTSPLARLLFSLALLPCLPNLWPASQNIWQPITSVRVTETRKKRTVSSLLFGLGSSEEAHLRLSHLGPRYAEKHSQPPSPLRPLLHTPWTQLHTVSRKRGHIIL